MDLSGGAYLEAWRTPRGGNVTEIHHLTSVLQVRGGKQQRPFPMSMAVDLNPTSGSDTSVVVTFCRIK